MESDSVVPPTLNEVVEAVSPEGCPITVYLDDEDAGRGLEAGLESFRSRFAESACEEKRVAEALVPGLINIRGTGRQEARDEKGKGGPSLTTGRIPTSSERLVVRQTEPPA